MKDELTHVFVFVFMAFTNFLIRLIKSAIVLLAVIASVLLDVSQPKNVMAAASVAAMVVFYGDYIQHIQSGVVRPAVFAWLTWAINITIGSLLQWEGGGGAGAFVLFSDAAVCWAVVVVAVYTQHADFRLNKLRIIMLSLACLASVMRFALDMPLLGTCVALCSSMLGTADVVRKIWFKPYEETYGVYVFGGFVSGMALVTNYEQNLYTWLYAGQYFLGTWMIAGFMWHRRTMLPQSLES